MIYDCVPFFNELEVLDIRLHELDPVVDFFVIVEATTTYQGNSKPLIFKENQERFTQFLPKIRYFGFNFPTDLEAQCRTGLYAGDAEVHKPGSGLDMNWARERYQHNYIMTGLTDCKEDDTILLCDLDEIPSADSVRAYKRHNGICTLNMLSFYYYLNHTVGDWNGPAKILPYDLLIKSTPSNIRTMTAPALERSTGWHYAWMGGAERVLTKLKSFAHAEYNTSGTTLEAVEQTLKLRQIGELSISNYTNYPAYVSQNKERFEKLGFMNYTVAPKLVLPAMPGPYRCK